MKKVRIGLVGAGAIAREHALSLCRSRYLADITVFDNDTGRAEALAAECSGSVARSLDETVDAADLLWICSPPKAHLDAVKAAVAAGRDIFCEKPLAFDLKTARQIAHVVKTSGVRFFMGQSGRYTPAFARMQAMAAKGMIGDLLEVWSTRLGYLDPKRSPAWRLDDNQSGGVALELGVHELDWCQWVGGPWQKVKAQSRAAVLAKAKFTEALNVLGTLQDGVQARVTLDWSSSRYLWQRGIIGTKGCLCYDDSEFNAIRVHQQGKPMKTVLAGSPDWKDLETGENITLRDQDRAILKAVAEKTAPPVTLEAGLGAVAAAKAAMQAARTQRPVTINV